MSPHDDCGQFSSDILGTEHPLPRGERDWTTTISRTLFRHPLLRVVVAAGIGFALVGCAAASSQSAPPANTPTVTPTVTAASPSPSPSPSGVSFTLNNEFADREGYRFGVDVAFTFLTEPVEDLTDEPPGSASAIFTIEGLAVARNLQADRPATAVWAQVTQLFLLYPLDNLICTTTPPERGHSAAGAKVGEHYCGILATNFGDQPGGVTLAANSSVTLPVLPSSAEFRVPSIPQAEWDLRIAAITNPVGIALLGVKPGPGFYPELCSFTGAKIATDLYVLAQSASVSLCG